MTGLAWVLYAVVVFLALVAFRDQTRNLLLKVKSMMGTWGKVVLWIAIATWVFQDAPTPGFILVATLMGAVLLGLPLFILIGAVVLVCFVFLSEGLSGHQELTLIIRKISELASKEVLLAIPFFIVSGELMTQGSLAQRLIDVAKALFGWVPGGLAVAAVFGCVFFAAISGSSPVTVIAIGSIMVPALIKAGYPEKFSIGLLTSAGSLGILIPPSIPMIVYAIMVSASTPVDPTDLFLAGVGPGLFIGGMLAAYSIYTGYRLRIPTDDFSASAIFREFKRGFWSLLLPVIILGGIYSGIFTPTEAAAVSVVYALVVELFIHGDLKPKQLLAVGEKSMTMMGALLLIMALAISLNHYLVLEQIPDAMVEWIREKNYSQVEFLITVNILLLLVGTVMDIMSAILILAPMLAPMSAAMGIHPLHMGIIFIVNLEIGYLTPPVGLNLFVSSTLFGKGLGEIIRSVIPTLLILFVGLVAITWVPSFSTALVDMIHAPAQKPAPQNQPEATPDAKPGVKSLQDLMKGLPQSDETAPKVKSLQELMQGLPPTPKAPPKVKSLQELMQDNQAPAPTENEPSQD